MNILWYSLSICVEIFIVCSWREHHEVLKFETKKYCVETQSTVFLLLLSGYIYFKEIKNRNRKTKFYTNMQFFVPSSTKFSPLKSVFLYILLFVDGKSISKRKKISELEKTTKKKKSELETATSSSNYLISANYLWSIFLQMLGIW